MAQTRKTRDETLLEQVGKMIDEKLGAQEQAQKEEKDPWARLEGIVDRTVKRHFDAREQARGTGRTQGGGQGEADDEEEEAKGFFDQLMGGGGR